MKSSRWSSPEPAAESLALTSTVAVAAYRCLEIVQGSLPLPEKSFVHVRFGSQATTGARESEFEAKCLTMQVLLRSAVDNAFVNDYTDEIYSMSHNGMTNLFHERHDKYDA